jgi:RNA polymerase sigma-32 factor
MARPPKKPGKPRKPAERARGSAARPAGTRARAASPRPASPRRGRQARPEPEEIREATPVRDSETSAEQTEPVDADSAAEETEPDGEELAELEPVTEAERAAPARPATRSTDRSIARADPMTAYMAEVQRHPLLSREEEDRLARLYRGSGDLDAAARLVSANLRLVVKLAHEYHRNPLSLLDLVQEGNIGLMQAVKKFDPDRGVKLSTYAAWWIRAYILRYIMDNWKLVKLGTTEAQRKLFFKLRQEQERLLKQGYEATPKLLAERLNVTEQDVVEMDQRLGPDEVSIDAPVGDDGDTTRGDRILPASGFPAADERLASEELKRLFRDKLEAFGKTLEGKEKFIFEKRLTADEPMTLQDIGTHFGFSRERARQIEAALVNRMREFVRSEMPDFDLVAEPKP